MASEDEGFMLKTSLHKTKTRVLHKSKKEKEGDEMSLFAAEEDDELMSSPASPADAENSDVYEALSLSDNEEEDDDDNIDISEASKIWEKFGTKPDGFENKLKKSQLVATMRYASNYWTPSAPQTQPKTALNLAKKLFGRTPCKCGELFMVKRKKPSFTIDDIVYVYRCEMFKRIR